MVFGRFGGLVGNWTFGGFIRSDEFQDWALAHTHFKNAINKQKFQPNAGLSDAVKVTSNNTHFLGLRML